MSHIYKNPVETEVNMLVRILSVSVNIQKHATYFCIQTQRSVWLTCKIIMKSQAASSTAIAKYSKILQMNNTTIERFDQYF
jgi:hypothetical protein